eukprot:1057974-Rhodomonas_salina.2
MIRRIVCLRSGRLSHRKGQTLFGKTVSARIPSEVCQRRPCYVLWSSDRAPQPSSPAAAPAPWTRQSPPSSIILGQHTCIAST